MRLLQIVANKITAFGRTMKRNIEETSEKVFTMSPKKVFVDSDASKGSRDEGAN